MTDTNSFWEQSRVLIVAGKGGVGKTTVTAALAVAAAKTGRSVQIVEIEGKSGLSRLFGSRPLSDIDQQLAPNIRGRQITSLAALLEYLNDHGMRRVAKRMIRSGVADVVATAVPGLRDLLVMGKIRQMQEARVADVIVVDAPAAGHALAFLATPRRMEQAARVGPLRNQAERAVAMLEDPSRCRVVPVTLPEHTPVSEMIQTAEWLTSQAGVVLAPAIVNMVNPDVSILADQSAASLTTAADRAGLGWPEELIDACAQSAAFAVARGEQQHAEIARLAKETQLDLVSLPLIFEAEVDRSGIDHLADAFTAGIQATDRSATHTAATGLDATNADPTANSNGGPR